MNYLQLAQSLARISGSVDPSSITTLQDAKGRIRLLADLLESAWTEIQNTYNAWTFLTVEFPEGTVLTDGVAAYGVGAGDLGLDNWAEWIPGTASGTIPLTLWEAGSRAGERPLTFFSYPEFRARYQRGANAEREAARPQVFSIDLQDRLVFWPVPDAAYRLAGTYRRSAQVLSADDDEPIIADQYHRTLVHAAKILLDHSDEADGNVLLADIDLPMTFQASLASLRRRYLQGGSGSISRGTAVGQGSSFRPVAPVSVVVNT